MLIPIVTTQVVYQSSDISILDKVEDVLKNTSKKDVENHWKFRKKAREVSEAFPNDTYYDCNNLYEYYCLKKNDFENNVHKEYITGFQRIKECYSLLEKNYCEENLLDCTIEAYDIILEKCGHYCGLAADYICVALYLFLTKNPKAIVI